MRESASAEYDIDYGHKVPNLQSQTYRRNLPCLFPDSDCSGVLLKGIVIPSDGTATASNVLTHRSLLQAGCAVSLISTALYVVMAALFYELFRPVNRTLSLVASFFAVVGCAIQAGGTVFQLLPLIILSPTAYLQVFSVDHLHALALLSFNLRAQTSNIELVFFGLYDLTIGFLIFRSSFLPRALGVLMALAGLGWLAFPVPQVADLLSPYNLIMGFLAEVALMLWLILRGVNAERWTAQEAE